MTAKKQRQRRTLKYTIYPPLITPFDILVTRINNYFLDLVYFIGTFNNMAEGLMEHFEGFDYRYDYQAQFSLQIEYPPPLNPAVCEYCLAYLHWVVKLLSEHPLNEVDIQGTLEDPTKGWQRRLGIILSLYEGRNTKYGKNFSVMAEKVKSLVKGPQSEEVSAAITELYVGAREIWVDINRIESNIGKPEYFYYGPKFKAE